MQATAVNIARATHGKKGIEMTAPNDYMPKWDEEERKRVVVKKQSVGEMKSAILEIARVHNKQFRDKEKKKRTTPPIKRSNRK